MRGGDGGGGCRKALRYRVAKGSNRVRNKVLLSTCVPEIKRRERNGRGDNDGQGAREEDWVVSRRKWDMKINSRANLYSRAVPFIRRLNKADRSAYANV